MMQFSSKTVVTLLAAAAIACAAAGSAAAEERSLLLTDFYMFPAGHPEAGRIDYFHYETDDSISALVQIELGGFQDESKVDAYFVIYDSSDNVLEKRKSKQFLRAGSHDIIFENVMHSAAVFGEGEYRARVEIEAKGTDLRKEQSWFIVSGPDAPEVTISNLRIWNPKGGRTDGFFEPGDEFVFDGLIEISGNDSEVSPRLIVFAMLEEDELLTDPFAISQVYDKHYDAAKVPWHEGKVEFQLRGLLPRFFYEAYEFSHQFRLYAIVDFGPGAVTNEYAEARIDDYYSGQQRQSDDLHDRLIDLERAVRWEMQILHPGMKPIGSPDPFWDD